jgi:crotonobetainyl-CoA:carnitine CoA-transferase CaiB-like acyl-CoA transferase
LQAYGGILSVTGTSEAGPMRAGPSIMDFGTGMWTALAVIAALYRRTVTGKGCRIETSLLETALRWMGLHLANFATDGVLPVPMGAVHPLVAPYGAYQASDGPVIIATGSERLFQRLAKALGQDAWLADPRFADNTSRGGHRA